MAKHTYVGGALGGHKGSGQCGWPSPFPGWGLVSLSHDPDIVLKGLGTDISPFEAQPCHSTTSAKLLLGSLNAHHHAVGVPTVLIKT